MVIDLLEKGRVNIKDLVLPDPRGKEISPFDPERFLTDNDVANINSLINHGIQLMASGERERFDVPYWLASDLKIVSPSKFSQLTLGHNFFKLYNDRVFKDLNISPGFAASDFAKGAAIMKIIDPNRIYALTLHESTWESVLRDLKNDDPSHLFIADAFYSKILFPSQFGRLKLGEECGPSMDQVKQIIADQKGKIRSRKELNTSFFNTIANARVVYSLTRDDLNLKSTEWGFLFEDVEKLKAQLPKEGIGDIGRTEFLYITLIDLLRDLKLLMAEEVEVTDKGLQIAMPDNQEFKEESASLPKTRKF